MGTLIDAAAVGLPILYTLTLVAKARHFVGREDGLARVRTTLLVTTVVAHGLAIAARAMVLGACPVVGAADQLSVSAFVIVAMALGVRFRLGTTDSTAVFTVTLAAVLQLLASVLSIGGERISGAPPFWPSLHIFTALVGLSAVMVTGIYGLLFLALYRAIQRSRFNLFFQRLPDLEALSRINARAALIAFLLLTATAVVGIERAVVEERDYNLGRVVLAMALWLLYGVALVGYWFFRLGGRRLASLTFGGLLLAIPVHIINVLGAAEATP